MKSNSAKCGHVKRRLAQNERLTGVVLDFALGVLDEGMGSEADTKKDEFLRGIAAKLVAGETLDDYECHYMVDVLLSRKRMSG